MRQGQQNRRGRGRSNNNNNSNRKSQNPMTRSFESTGPDVKLRGTPSHVAEKYMSLARDALSSGDPVLAENYMQHAEHYNRIIMTFREQQMSAGGSDPYTSGMGRPATMGGPDADGDDFSDDEGEDFGGENRPMTAQPDQQSPPQQTHQPRSFDQPQRYDNRPQHQHQRRDQRHNQNYRNDRNENRFDRGDRQDRQDFRSDRGHDRGPDRNQERGHDRGPDRNQDRQQDRNFDRNGGGEPRGFRDERPVQAAPQFVPPPAIEPVSDVAPPRRRERPPVVAAEQPGQAPLNQDQPEFLRRPVRRPRVERDEAAAPAPQSTDDQD